MPGLFSECIGHAAAVAFLQATLAAGRSAHAYLFTGPPQIGKGTLARALAAAVLCSGNDCPSPSVLAPPGGVLAYGEAPGRPAGAPAVPCGACKDCLLVARETHPDVRMVAPDPGRKGITIEQVRQLEHAAGLRPYAGRRKVFIVEGVDAMAEAAANALLKTLEEPPDDTVLVLTAGDASQVLPTIASRCQEVALRPVPAPEIAAALVRRGTSAAEADLLARLAGGRPGWAIAAAADPQRRATRGHQVAALEGLLAQRRLSRLPEAASFGDAAAAKEVLDTWLGWWRDVLLVQQGCPELVANTDRIEALRRVGATQPVETVWRVLTRIQATRELLDANANVRLALEVLLLDLPEPRAT